MKELDIKIIFRMGGEEDSISNWHNELEIMYVLQGSGQLNFAETKRMYQIKKDDIFAINPLQAHRIISKEHISTLSLFIPQGLLLELCSDLDYPLFEFYSFNESQNQQNLYDSIRIAFANAFKAYYKKESKYQIHLKAKIIQLVDLLIHNFLVEHGHNPIYQSGRGRLLSAIKYIHTNYNRDITLRETAKNTFLTNTYLSRLFTENLGQTFTEYLNSVRIYHANMLLSSTKTLTEISGEAGFSNANTMIIAYKRQYGMTPKEFKLKRREKKVVNIDMFEMDSIESFSSLLCYTENNQNLYSEDITYRSRDIEVDYCNNTSKINQTWRQIVNAGRAKEILCAEIQEQLIRLQKSIHFQYARIKGILDEDLGIYKVDEKGRLNYNFVLLDEVIDFILTIDLTPYLCLNYMPGNFSMDYISDNSTTGKLQVSNYHNKWESIIIAIVEHLQIRYGKNLIKNWLFSPFTSPHFIRINVFTEDEYWKIYSKAHQILKSADLTVVSPICNINYYEMIDMFLSQCKKLGCMPDRLSLISIHVSEEPEKYDMFNVRALDKFNPGIISANEDYIQTHLDGVKDILKKHRLEKLPIQLDEWNNNLWQRDLCNDTCFKSSYIFKQILENHDSFSGMAFWSNYDRYEEAPPSPELFHGGCGLFTRRGIAKAGFYAFVLLEKMGTTLQTKGKGYFISSNKSGIQIFLYNYVHYDELYRNRHATSLSLTDRYNVFNKKDPELYNIAILGLPEGNYSIRKWSITTKEGSAYDEWLKIGAPQKQNIEIHDYLNSKAAPAKTYGEIECHSAVLKVKATLQPHDIVLIEIDI